MDRPFAQGGLGKAFPRFDLATDADDAEIRRITRDNPMDGMIRLSFEREPDARVAAAIEGPLLHQTVVGRRSGGGLFGFGTRSVRLAYINGQQKPLGYLGALRLDADHRGTASVLRQGYRRLQQLHEADGLTPLYLTSIMWDNRPARRVLEAGISELPTYRPVGEFVTFIIAARSPRRFSSQLPPPRLVVGSEMQTQVHEFQTTAAARRQFAQNWIDQPMAPPADDVRVAIDGGGRIEGMAALWDQRRFKQTVVRGYGTSLGRFRWLANACLRFSGQPPLPAVGTALKLAYVSSLATADGVGPEVAVALVDAIRKVAQTRGLDYLCIGLPANDRRLTALVRAFNGRQLRSQLYVVFWSDGRAAADALDDRPLGAEVALL